MRFLANENFPGDAVAALAATGHDVLWIRIAAPGIKDEEVLAWAVRETRVLLTFDQDFGELAWRAGLPAACGIVLFRMPMPAATKVGVALAARLDERNDWPGHFSVVQPGRIRMRPLPNSSHGR
jgi:predicted nuclease of predicted toxin-antitoxin system